MTVEKIICDECGRTKAEANHWFQIGTQKFGERVAIELGVLQVNRTTQVYEVHDLCGEQCFHKHIAKLLGFNPATEEAKP